MLGALLDRERELAEIGGLLEAARAGSGGLAVVEGPAGIGKTRLVQEAARVAGVVGCEVLRARGSKFEAEIPFGVARQLFEPVLRASSGGERRRLLAGVAGLGARALGLAGGERPADRFAAIHGLFWLCANRAERGPVVVLVDDVQWVDDPSLAWLGYLARRVGIWRCYWWWGCAQATVMVSAASWRDCSAMVGRGGWCLGGGAGGCCGDCAGGARSGCR
jgi:predicted ATPase